MFSRGIDSASEKSSILLHDLFMFFYSFLQFFPFLAVRGGPWLFAYTDTLLFGRFIWC